MERLSAGVFLLIFASLQGAMGVNVEVFPPEAIVSVGQNVSMLCRVSVPIQYCRIEVPGLNAPLNLNPLRGPTPPSNAVYLGEGLEKGHCGVSIPRVEDQYNGVFKCSVGTPTEAHESQGTMVVVVARAPTAKPKLDITRPRDPQDSYHEGERFLASCEVPEGRPAANISWFIGDEPVTEGLTRPEIIENTKDNLFSVRQNLTREVRWSDNGKELRCVAGHPILGNDPIRTTDRKRITVKFAPKPAPGDLEQFGFIEGEDGLITVRIKANPKPSFLWTVGRENIDEGTLDSTEHFEVGFAEPKDNGEWETKLHIRPVTKEDVEREYRVQATNTIGQQDYVVRISTSSKPRAIAEMGAGAIVGIVIAVLLVLLIIFVVVFARATGRWCFAAGGGRGKSSQTSSVAHIDPEGHSEKAKHAGVGGTENPSINHNVSSEYINGNDIKKEIKEDTPV